MRLPFFTSSGYNSYLVCSLHLHFLPSLEFIHRMHFTKKLLIDHIKVSLLRHFVADLYWKKSDCSSSPMMSSMLGLASGARFRHLRMRARSVRFFTMATCSSRLSGSGSFRVQISQRRTPKLYTSTYARKQNYSLKKKIYSTPKFIINGCKKV